MAVRALVFDVFGTLVDWRSGVAEAFRASGVAGDAEELADAWRARYPPILAEVNDGARPWGNFDELHLVTLDAVLAERGVELSGHAYKPAPAVYQTAARLLDVEPTELMMVAAHPSDLRGARAAGLRTAFVDRPLEYGPLTRPREDPDADESVADLHELAERLAG